jgi:hypothetical protein
MIASGMMQIGSWGQGSCAAKSLVLGVNVDLLGLRPRCWMACSMASTQIGPSFVHHIWTCEKYWVIGLCFSAA